MSCVYQHGEIDSTYSPKLTQTQMEARLGRAVAQLFWVISVYVPDGVTNLVPNVAATKKTETCANPNQNSGTSVIYTSTIIHTKHRYAHQNIFFDPLKKI